MGKRKNGEGSYSHKMINGIKYYTYSNPGQSWTVYARTQKDLEEKRRKKEETLKEQESLRRTPHIILMMDIFDLWMKDIVGKVSARTYDDYETIVEKRLKGYEDLSKRQAKALNIKTLNDYLASLKTKYAKTTIDKTWVVLRQAIEYGQKEKYIPMSLNLEEIVLPSKNDVEKEARIINFITPEDMDALYDESKRLKGKNTAFYGNAGYVIDFIMYSGVRISESIALSWRDVSYSMDEVVIRRSATTIKKREKDGTVVTDSRGHAVYEKKQKTTKTQSGENRIIPLPDRGIEVLKHFDQAFPDHKPDDLVFRTENGTQYDARNLQRTLKRMLKNSDCKCKEYTPHSLRHGYGSVLLSKGVEINTVSKLLGHKKVSTTYNIYIHILQDDTKKAVKSVFNKN